MVDGIVELLGVVALWLRDFEPEVARAPGEVGMVLGDVELLIAPVFVMVPGVVSLGAMPLEPPAPGVIAPGLIVPGVVVPGPDAPGAPVVGAVPLGAI